MRLPPPAYALGSFVYARTNPEMAGMVTGYVIRPGDTIIYLVTWAEEQEERECWAIELTNEKGFTPEE